MLEGKGKCEYCNNDQYNGEFKDDMMHGYGRYVDEIGNTYDGDFRNDKRHGKVVVKGVKTVR